MRNPFKSKRTNLPKPAAGVQDFMVVVHVKLHEPIYAVDNPESFCVRANPLAVREIILRLISDGEIDWSDSEWHAADVTTLDPVIQRMVTPITDDGVWYRSGGAIYPGDSDDPDLESILN